MHGTPNQATLSYLRLFGYEHMYPNANHRWRCVCDPRCSFIVDMMVPGGGHAIVKGVSKTDHCGGVKPYHGDNA